MRAIGISLLAICLSAPAAFSQTTTQGMYQPAAPAVATPPAPLAAQAQGITLSPALGQQLQGLLGKGKSNQAMSQALVMGAIISCTQKQAGKEATQAFYQEMQTTGKAIEADCKAGQPGQARTLLLSTLDAKHNDPVYKSALGCYDAQSANLSAMAGPQLAEDLNRYATWARDPAAARREMKDSDICRPSTKGQK